MVTLKENISPNEEHARADNLNLSLRFTNLISPNSLPVSLKKKLKKDKMKIGESSGGLSQLGMELSIPVKQDIEGLVKNLKAGKYNVGARMGSHMLTNLGHMEDNQIFEAFHEDVLDDEGENGDRRLFGLKLLVQARVF